MRNMIAQFSWTMKLCRHKWLLGIIALIYFITFLMILPLLCSNFVYSFYRSSYWTREVMINKIKSNNKLAAVPARKYIQDLKISEVDKLKIDKFPAIYKHHANSTVSDRQSYSEFLTDDLSLVIVVVTVRRVDSKGIEYGYLTRVVAALDRLMKKDSLFQRKTLIVCNVEAGPGINEEAARLDGIFNTVYKYPNGSTADSILDPFEKEKRDYLFCARHALIHRTSMVLMVEDDALPLDDLFPVLHYVVSGLSQGDRIKPWTLIKMYFPERWQGYAYELASLIELLAIATIGGSCSVLLWLITQQPPCSRSGNISARGLRSYLLQIFPSGSALKGIRPSVQITFLAGALYLALVVLLIGRQHLLELRRYLLPTALAYSLVPAPECCTPAVLYHTASLLPLVNQLNSFTCNHDMPLDKAMSEFIRKGYSVEGLTQLNSYSPSYLVLPNLFEHVGLMSTIKGISSNPEEYLL